MWEPSRTVAANPYDDTVFTMTAGDLLTPLSASGSLKDPNVSLSATMTLVKNAVIAKAYNASTGGSGTARTYAFPADLGFMPSVQINDPWGTVISYTLPTTTVSCATPAATPVFTLKSSGPDKIPSTDDPPAVTVYASDIHALIISAGGCTT